MTTKEEQKKDITNKKSPLTCFDLWVMFDHASFAIARTRALELANFGLTIEQAAVLHDLIRRGGSATLSEIAESTMRQYHSVSTLVNRMTKAGLTKKVKYSDTKKYQVSITEKGFDIYSKVSRNSIEMTFSVLSPSNQKVFAKQLQHLIARARNLLGLDYKHPFLP